MSSLASAAKNMMPGNLMAIATDLYAHLCATVVFQDAGEKRRAEASLRQAGMDANELKQFPALPMSYERRWYYLNFTAQEDAAYEVGRRGYQEAESGTTRRIYAESLYERREFEKAREVIESTGSGGEFSSRDAKLGSGVYWMRPIVLAELPDGHSRALQAYRENCELFPKEGRLTSFNRVSLLLIGSRSDVMDACRELLDQVKRLADINPEHYLPVLEYCAERMSAEELLKAAAGSRRNRCTAHFYIALNRLNQGDRTTAREHFGKVLATGVFNSLSYEFGRLFLKRMEQDPNWPPWITLKEPTAQPIPDPGQ